MYVELVIHTCMHISFIFYNYMQRKLRNLFTLQEIALLVTVNNRHHMLQTRD